MTKEAQVILYVLNVGDGSSTIIEHASGRISLVDIYDTNNKAHNKAHTAIANLYPGKEVFRFILTHPDMDHLTGIKHLFESLDVINFWDTANTKSIDDKSWAAGKYDKNDWEYYQKIRQSEASPKILKLYRGHSGLYWEDDRINILSPTSALVKSANANPDDDYHDLSYVLQFIGPDPNRHSVLLAGDASAEALQDITDYYREGALISDVLIAPHHGSESNYVEEFVTAVSPEYIVVSSDKSKYEVRHYEKHVDKGKLLITGINGHVNIGLSGSQCFVLPHK